MDHHIINRKSNDRQDTVKNRTTSMRLGTTFAALGVVFLLTACAGIGEQAVETEKVDSQSSPDLELAKQEGTLTIWYSEQEKPMVSYINAFSEATGIQAEGVRIDSGDIFRKFETEKRVGAPSVDVFMSADLAVANRLQEDGYLENYISPETENFSEQFKSDPEGWWTSFYLAVEAVGYDPKQTDPSEAPTTYEDLLDPKWKGRLAFQDAAAGSQYLWWYLVKDVVSEDYFEKLATQDATAYPSSTAIVQELRNGNALVAGKFSDFQFTVAEKDGAPLGAVYPEAGVPAGPHGISLVKATQRPNAAKAFIDYTLSKEGQTKYNSIAGSRSARSDVVLDGVTDLSSKKLLVVSREDFEDFASKERAEEFQQVWRSVVG